LLVAIHDLELGEEFWPCSTLPSRPPAADAPLAGLSPARPRGVALLVAKDAAKTHPVHRRNEPMLTRQHPRRQAVAAVEFAFLAPVLLILLAGVWQIGRIIQVAQILDNAAREGARLASQSEIIAPVGGFTLIQTSTGIPNVQDTIREYLYNAGVVNATTKNDVTVQFQFLTGDTTRTDPYQGNQGDRFQITVTLPVQDINWTPFDMTGTNLTTTVVWAVLVDSPFTVNTTVPGWSP
jgi:Flp pilus assembly protein TadG